jgi:outer membrane receptor protein involved in Fe transport
MRSSRYRRIGARYFTAVSLAVLCATARAADLDTTVKVDVAQQPLRSALLEFSKQASIQLVIDSSTLPARDVAALTGTVAIRKALDALLRDTDLEYRWTGEHTVTIVPRAPSRQTGALDVARGAERRYHLASSEGDAQTDTAAAAAQEAKPTADSDNAADVQEIIVSAQKRAERLQDVPISVAAFDRETISRLGMTEIGDISRLTPGLDVTTGFGGQSIVSIRGVVWSVGAATTGIYIDDTPIQVRFVGQGATAGNTYPDLFDLDRIEVLRGPQGTLFGSGSEGGTIRFITPQPSLTQWSGHAKAEFSFLDNGKPASQFGAAIGGPLGERVGFRLSAHVQEDAGWVDRIPDRPFGQVEKNSNDGNTQAVNAALSWAVTDRLTVTPSVFYQRQHDADTDLYWPDLSRPSKQRFVNGHIAAQPLTDTFVLPSLKATLDLSGISIYSNTSYLHRTRTVTQDYSYYLTELLTGAADGPVTPAPTRMENPQEQFTQELRIQSTDEDSRLRWVVGGFYQRVTQHANQFLQSPDLDSLTNALFGASVADVFGIGLLPGGYSYIGLDKTVDEQLSAFGQADLRLTAQWTLTAGLRRAHVSFDHANSQDGPFNGGTTGSSIGSSENQTTPKFGVTYKPSEDLMFYASAAKGFRAGGGNTPIPTALCAADLSALGLTEAPEVYGSDYVWSYELGTKGNTPGRRLKWDVSGFYIDWKEIQSQITLSECGFAFISNLGSAVSKGINLQLEGSVTPDWVVSTAVGYTDARNADTILGPNQIAIVTDGDRLAAAPWHFSLATDYKFMRLANGASLYAHFDGEYVNAYRSGNSQNALYDAVSHTFRQNFFSMARVGFLYDRWDVSAFAKNLTGSHSVLVDQHWVASSARILEGTYAPRTIGLTATYRF